MTYKEFNRGVFDFLIATDASIDKGAVDEEELDDDDDDDVDRDNDGDGNDGDNNKSKRRKSDNNIKNNASTKNSKRSNKINGDVDYGVSRGIDFQDVNFVVNFDFPVTTAAYTHRVGRTGRGGSMGTSLSFASIASTSSNSSSTANEIEIARRDQEVLEMIRHEQPKLNPSIYTNNILAAIGANSNSNNNEDVRQSSSFSSSSSSSSSSSNDNDDHLLQPSLLQFNMKELDSFRYRVEDTLRSVTNAAVKELRAAELKKEILNSEKLKSYFAENPNDLKVC
jgi:ATP-dependent RNA helicase DDX56/DBP9